MSIEEESKEVIYSWMERETKESDEKFAFTCQKELLDELLPRDTLCKECKKKSEEELVMRHIKSLEKERAMTDICEDEAIALSLREQEERMMCKLIEDEAYALSLREQEEKMMQELVENEAFARSLQDIEQKKQEQILMDRAFALKMSNLKI